MPRGTLSRPLVTVAATFGLVALTLTGCAGSSDQGTGSPTPTRSATEGHDHEHGDEDHASGGSADQSGPADTTVDVRIADGKVVSDTPSRVEVGEGDTVRIVVRSDAPDEVHVHGYDLESEVGPGEPATFTFPADQTGLFEVETHESETVLFQLLVR